MIEFVSQSRKDFISKLFQNFISATLLRTSTLIAILYFSAIESLRDYAFWKWGCRCKAGWAWELISLRPFTSWYWPLLLWPFTFWACRFLLFLGDVLMASAQDVSGDWLDSLASASCISFISLRPHRLQHSGHTLSATWAILPTSFGFKFHYIMLPHVYYLS